MKKSNLEYMMQDYINTNCKKCKHSYCWNNSYREDLYECLLNNKSFLKRYEIYKKEVPKNENSKSKRGRTPKQMYNHKNSR